MERSGNIPAVEAPGHKLASASNLHTVRVQEGLSKAQLARLANLSERTVRIVEKGERRVREETLSQILNAINRNPRKIKREAYAIEEVFPTAPTPSRPTR